MTVGSELVRISVIGGHTQIDLAVPAGVPVVALMPDILALLRVDSPPGQWTLAPLGGACFAASGSLRDNEVHDGDLLVLTDDAPGSPGRAVDDVAAAVAHLTTANRAAWTAESARWTAYATVGIATIVAVVATVLTAQWGRADTALVIAAVASAAALTGAILGSRGGGDSRTNITLSLAASALAAAAGFAAGGPTLGSQLAAAGVLATGVAIVGGRLIGALAAHAAIATTGFCAAAIGALAAGWDAPTRSIAAIGAALAVLVLMLAGRIAIAAARLPLPPVPVASPPADDHSTDRSVVDGVDALGPPPPDPLGAIADVALVELDAVAQRTATASSYLTGLLLGATLVTVAATLVTASAGPPNAVSLAYCASVVGILLTRGRVHADRLHSAILLIGAGLCAAGIPLALALVASDGTAALTALFVALGVGAAALVAGLVVPRHDYSPLQLRAAEIAQFIALAALFPLLLWVIDAYRLVREF